MTLEQAKDQVAKNHSYPSWNRLCHNGVFDGAPEMYTDEAAELYARSKWDEACEAQKSHCSFSLGVHSDVLVYPTDFPKMHERIMNASKPEFK